jgi:uncharacterized oxidoreductase
VDLNNSTVVVTGGATGIGFAIAEGFLNAGSQVIVCGRREDRLKLAQSRLPQIITRVCDIAREQERQSFIKWVKENYKETNILVNNAGIQRIIDFKAGPAELLSGENEIETNLAAPVYLSAHFIPLLLRQSSAAIINVSSGLGFVPIAAMPVYCATKAALHLFSISLRYQLKDTPVKVFEIIPPMVDTELGGEPASQQAQEYRGIPPQELAREALTAIQEDDYEVAVGDSGALVEEARTNFEKAFRDMNSW